MKCVATLFWLFTLTFSGLGLSCEPVPDRYVGIAVHPLYIYEPGLSCWLVDRLLAVDLVQLPICLGGNSTENIIAALNLLDLWLSHFTDYDVSLQTYYLFGEPSLERSMLRQYNLSTLSEEFYENYYGALSNLIVNYSNVKYMVGFNEPYLCLDENDVPTLIKRQYETWKKFTDIPFSTEFNMPLEYWREGGRPYPSRNVTWNTMLDMIKNYSDYIGVNLWTQEASEPINDFNAQWYLDTWELLKEASATLGKPIFLAELPCRYHDVFKIISDEAMTGDNICQIYCLAEVKSRPADTCMFEIDEETGTIIEVNPSYSNFMDILTRIILTLWKLVILRKLITLRKLMTLQKLTILPKLELKLKF